MKLLFSPASPFVAKVRMAARHVGIKLECIQVDAVNNQAELLASNPLGKIPCLILANDRGVFDSKVIMRELDRQSGGKLFSGDQNAQLETELLESLADGLSDCAVAGMYELRMRPEEKVHQPWFDRQWDKVVRGLDHLEGNCPPLTGTLTAGHFALAALLGYLDLRYPDKWQEGHKHVAKWQTDFANTFAAYEELKPQA